jgi:putative ATP-dependent endonuclease of OLD family
MLELDPKDINKINRYLNVTRASLFFSNRVLLLEGLAEAILIPTFARHIVYKNLSSASEEEKIKNTQYLSRFTGTTIIAIDGVDFNPYLKLLKTEFNGISIADLVVVLTDDDIKHGDPNETPSRIIDALEVLGEINVKVSKHTLEADLFRAGNENFLKTIYLEIHPRSAGKWMDNIESLEDEIDKKSSEFVFLIEKKKGELSQKICEKIEAGEPFIVPPHIVQAIQLLAEYSGVSECENVN